jgi:hypothetical protein
MMAIHSDKNLYSGINAHLNSDLQEEGWQSFHNAHVIHICEVLKPLLPPNYYAISERSLQVSEYVDAIPSTSQTRPDVSVFQRRSSPTGARIMSVAQPTLEFPLSEMLPDDEDGLASVGIYRLENRKLPGKLVTRIEILSPANKPPHDYHRDYLRLRLETLRAGVSLVELDYLHWSAPLLDFLPSYRNRDEGAYPYMIFVSDARPTPKRGQFRAYGFGVDVPIPKIALPLADEDTVEVDFNLVYNQTFEYSALFALTIDYAQDPPHFERYSPEDRARISALLNRIRSEHSG